MKPILYALLFSVVVTSCQKNGNEKAYVPRTLTSNESFNDYPKGTDSGLNIEKLDAEGDSSKEGSDPQQIFTVKFRDTLVQIQTNKADQKNLTAKFAVAEFLNTQKTSLLVQLADHSGLTAPFYLISLKDGQLDIVSLYRPSKGKDDKKFTKGLSRIGRSGFLLNNDFFITTVYPKVYLLKRQNEEERIQGLHFVTSTDRNTLVFMEDAALYEVNYRTGDAFTQPLSKAPKTPTELYPWIQNNFSWQKNDKGASFLKMNKDDNRIIDIKDFKKS